MDLEPVSFFWGAVKLTIKNVGEIKIVLAIKIQKLRFDYAPAVFNQWHQIQMYSIKYF